MTRSHISRSFLILCFLSLVAGCESFLDEKPDKQQVIPSTLRDFQALLDDFSQLNDNDPAAGEVSTDDYYLEDATWASLSETERLQYTWSRENFFTSPYNDWATSYTPVYTANTVLEGLTKVAMTPANQDDWRNVKGQAHFIRGKSFLQVAILWAPAYTKGNATGAWGIPLRLSTDFEEKSRRSNLQESFDQVLSDLQQAAKLLPPTQVHPVRPSKAAAYALLARTHLYMGNYPAVAAYADSALQLHSSLLDFNSLSAEADFPFSQPNEEIIYRSIIPVPNALYISNARIDPELYASYQPGDLRHKLFFKSNGDGTYGFKGSYEGNANLFSGISTAELYLMKAEALAGQGDAAGAMDALNTLLVTRWETGTFLPLEAANAAEALEIIRQDRRRELLMRGIRWLDIKRLNASGAAITMSRSLEGRTYTLPPNDPRYALPIPEDVIRLSGMPQNPR
ncbi:RagB/SusD family nutrient uptake outer membrane protein [Pontibacter sp. Tf4]|uniref:RagB/SusD family nutrient uptake outer membrane protein n=1 Tax=Pontibacter sp. Tf4 TaxID=2761620 RepID=UPI0016295EE8|nr:RagB/SusD family nutrient uptake outer membrane protein [Pontibacter sp. Tf4]MBB6611798.1 RagB/SusD family nutrient uptake outer membrane protein [Pontibacter sp. Tf4]